MRRNPWSGLSGLVLMSVLGCGGSHSEQLTLKSSSAQSRDEQTDYRELHGRWTRGTTEQRRALEGPLRAYLHRFGGGGRSRQVRVYLALIHIERGQLALAQTLLAQARSGPTGTSLDLARVAEAAILIREGKPQQALAVLEPLSGKIIDPDERYVYGEQIVKASLLARRWRGAVDQMLSWLAHVKSEDTDSVQRALPALLARIPADALEQRLLFLDAEAASSLEARALEPARDWLRKLLRERLIRVAISERDGPLAARLLDSGPPALRRSEQGADLSRLAAGGSVLPRVAGRAVGLVLSLGNVQSRRRAVAVAAGMTRALGLPQVAENPGSVSLVTEDEAGEPKDMESALTTLAGEGAAILVAGVDEAGASIALRYAGQSSIPVILLHIAGPQPINRFSFLLGADSVAVERALTNALTTRHVAAPVRVGPRGVPCSSHVQSANERRFPVDSWKRERIGGLLLLGDSECAKEVLAEIAASGLRPVLALGLDCAELLASVESRYATLAPGSGKFPRAGSALAGDTRAVPPNWYEVLGHDAAVLARAALQRFPLERVDDAKAVAKLHAKARDELAHAKAKLWSSESPGFNGQQVLPRSWTTFGSDTDEAPGLR